MTVSRETIEEKFGLYLALLRKWQKTINLVSAETIDDARQRHIDDSAQLAALIPDSAKVLMDWGSGGGFPGLVLAMMRPDLSVCLMESDERKCAFLRTVSRETKTPVTIRDVRVESLSPEELAPDVITCRAFAPLEKLLAYAAPWVQKHPGLILLFPKGETAEQELAEARKSFTFNVIKHPSATAREAVILEISQLCIT